jgi:O-methyltransferase domain
MSAEGDMRTADGKTKVVGGGIPADSKVKTRAATNDSKPGRNELSQLTQLYTSFAIRGLATLGVADVLASGPVPVEEIAEAVGGNTDALYRAMRFTASVGVFIELPGRVFALNTAAEYLKSDAPDSMRSRLMIDDNTLTRLQMLMEMPHTLRTGESGYHRVHGVGPFEADANRSGTVRVAVHPGSAQMLANGLLEADDFAADRVVVDVGGGTGTMIGAILARHPHLEGVLFDLSPVIAGAPKVLRPLGVTERCKLVGGDMFQGVPAGGDVYLMSFVLHDWADDKAAIVLANLRAAMTDDARLLVVEPLISEGPQAAQSIQQDFMMLVNGGGRERTASEHAALLAQAGFRLTNMTPVHAGLCILHAQPN